MTMHQKEGAEVSMQFRGPIVTLCNYSHSMLTTDHYSYTDSHMVSIISDGGQSIEQPTPIYYSVA
jgi:hypothetical protein